MVLTIEIKYDSEALSVDSRYYSVMLLSSTVNNKTEMYIGPMESRTNQNEES